MRNSWIIGLAALAAAFGALLFYESFLAPTGCCGATWPQANPVQAERLLARVDPGGHNAARQRETALRVLEARPGDSENWMRLAYADRVDHGRLTPEGLRAVDNSYSVAVYLGTNAPWRTAFLLDNWSALSVRTRQDALREIDIIKTAPAELSRLEALTPAVSDSDGRLVAAFKGVLPTAARGS